MQLLFLSACGSPNNTKKDSTSLSQNQTYSSSPNPARINIELSSDTNAAKVPELFYQYLNTENYKAAGALLGPQLKFEASPKYIKYLKNEQHTTFIKFKDISKNPGPLNPEYSKYYLVKVYYGEINIEVRDPSLVPSLGGINYRRFILVKLSKTSPWLLDTDEDTPKL